MKAVGDAEKCSLVVLGDTLLDSYSSVLRTEWDSGLEGWSYRTTEECFCAGGAANVAVNIRREARRVALVSRVGDDGPGIAVQRLLTGVGVDMHHVEVNQGGWTGELRRIEGLQGGDLRVDRGVALTRTRQELKMGWIRTVEESDAVVVADYGRLMTERAAREVVATCNAHGIALIVDPSRGIPSWYGGAHAFKLNVAEAVAISDLPENDHVALARYLCRHFDLRVAIITAGSEGAVAVTSDDQTYKAYRDARCANATGAGDALAAGMAVAFAEGEDMDVALQRGVDAGARAVESSCTCPFSVCLSAAVDHRRVSR